MENKDWNSSSRESPKLYSGEPRLAKTDVWQKISVVSTVFSTIVLAAIGLMFQRWSTTSSEAIARGQLELSRAQGEAVNNVQEGQVVTTLLKQLFESNGKHRASILVVLETHLPKDRYIALCSALAQEDSEENVRLAAIRQLGTTANQSGANVLSSITHDSSRPKAERALAEKSHADVEANRRLIFELLKGIQNDNPEIRLHVHLTGGCTESGTTADCFDGELARLEVGNVGSSPVFVQPVYLSSSGEATLLLSSVTVPPAGTVTTPMLMFTPPYGTDIIKVIASRELIDLDGFLRLASGKSYWSSLLRALGPVRPPKEWAVSDYVIRVKPK